MTHRSSPSLSRADQAYAALRRRLTRCEIPPGSDATAARLAADLGLGITPVREALIQLHREGLVDVLPRRGYVVPHLTVKQVRDTFDMWGVLRPHIVDGALRRIDAEQAHRLADLVVGARTAARGGDAETACDCFSRGWMGLAAACGNVLVAEVHRTLEGHLLRTMCVIAGLEVPAASADELRTAFATGPDAARAIIDTQTEVLREFLDATVAGLPDDAVFDRANVRRQRTEALLAPRLRPLCSTSLADEAYTRLRAAIVTGELAPGTRLTERALAARLDLGITPVREALARLDHERLVLTLPRRGYAVTRLTSHTARDVSHLWSVLAPAIMERAAARMTPEQGEEIVRLMTAQRADAGTGRTLTQLRSDGWHAMTLATGNIALQTLTHAYEGSLVRMFELLRLRAGTRTDTAPVDWALMFAARDPQVTREQCAVYARTVDGWARELVALLDAERTVAPRTQAGQVSLPDTGALLPAR